MMLRQRQAVAAAEGEAVRHTLREIGKELHEERKREDDAGQAEVGRDKEPS